MITKIYKRVLQHFLFIGVFCFISIALQGANAPITTIVSTNNAVPGNQVTIPVTVSGFENIGGITLALDYEYAKLQFVSGTYNPDLGGTCSIGEIDLGNGFRRLTISWFKFGDGVNLPDGSSVVDYVFTYISGPATLTWFDMGPSCVYNDPAANTLNDLPTSDYYINGVVSNAPIVNAEIATKSISDILEESATVSGNIISFGNPKPMAHGVCWSTESEPTIADSLTDNGEVTTTGVFSSVITGLISGTTYYVSVYATNCLDETVYGEELTFTTRQVAEVVTNEITTISETSATANGNLICLGVPNATAYGVCWSTESEPTIADSYTNAGVATITGAFNADLTGLIEGTTYYVRSYVSNEFETVYGNEISFKTFELPTVTAIEIIAISDSSAIIEGVMLSGGEPFANSCGICWNNSSNPTVLDNVVDVDSVSESGAFTSEINNLSSFTEYFVRAFACNSVGAVYSDEVSFKTLKRTGVSALGYPNLKVYASDGFVIIRSNESIKTDITVYNLIGEKVLSDKMNGKDHRILFNQLGVFVVKLNNNIKTVTRKVMF